MAGRRKPTKFRSPFLRFLDPKLAAGALGSTIALEDARRPRRDDTVTVLLDTEDCRAAAKKLRGWKCRTRRASRSVLIATVPQARLGALARMKSVKFIEAERRLTPTCDQAHAKANAWSSGGWTVSETGAGVLVGVIDTGIDVEHRAMGWGDGSSRIADYLDQEAKRHYTAPASGYLSATSVRTAALRSKDTNGHGTHVAGIAAGNGAGAPSARAMGVAPNADLAIVKTSFKTTDIADGVAHIFELADKRKQPCVVNLSLGGHWGGHDGSSVVERVIDELCEKPGRAVVVSAGNEGGSRTHAGGTMRTKSNGRRAWDADLELRRQFDENGEGYGDLWVQVWTLREDEVRVSLRGPNGQSFSVGTEGQEEFDRGSFIVVANRRKASYSGDTVWTFRIVTVDQPGVMRGWTIKVDDARKNSAPVGTVHAWIEDESEGYFSEGYTRSHLVGMPGTAFSAITVASFASRKKWRSVAGNIDLDSVNVDDISYFSSPGPTRDGQNKPEIAAPGQYILAPRSSQADVGEFQDWQDMPGRKYAALQGTSMAAPYVTGCVALLFEKYGPLHWAEIKRRMMKSVNQDGNTKPCWNNRWGYGKLDVERLLTVEPG